MVFINGTNNILYIEIDGSYLPVACLTSNNFEENIDTLETTTRDNAGWKTFTTLNQGFTLSFDGIMINTFFSGGDFTKVSLDKLRDLKRSRTLISWQLRDTDFKFVDSGQGYIVSLSQNSAIDDFVGFSGTILGYGQPASTSELVYTLGDGNNNIIEDGNSNEIITA